MIIVETTAPNAVEIGIAAMNQAVALARCTAGNHYEEHAGRDAEGRPSSAFMPFGAANPVLTRSR